MSRATPTLSLPLDPTSAPFSPAHLSAPLRQPTPTSASSGLLSHSQPGPSRIRADTDARPYPKRDPRTERAALELTELLGRESAKTKLRRLASHADAVPVFNPVCASTTLAACRKDRPAGSGDCTKTHYEPLIRPYTDQSLGHCSYLNLCYGDPLFARNPSLGGGSDGPPGARPPGGGKECRYLHFHVQPARTWNVAMPRGRGAGRLSGSVRRAILADGAGVNGDGEGRTGVASDSRASEVEGAGAKQWINCDLRSFDYSILGQFQVIMADPPWDIHMSLPYGTLTDDELRQLPIPALQPDWGVLALWVTGRAMELARELFAMWGYRRVDEVVWVKVNQLQRLIRTGRTGHWLNHTCEHLLVAVKLPASFPQDAPIPWDSDPVLRSLRRGVDTDVIVAEVRETSRKPDEIYSVLDRLCPAGRKLELFGRKHNTRPGWLTLGNQLGDSQVAERRVWEGLKGRYPEQGVRFVGEVDEGQA